MKLYHGSNVAIVEVNLSKSKPFKDFGKGFYLSDNIEQAFEMAKFKVSLFKGEPIVTSFEFDQEGMFSSSLKKKIFDNYSSEWLDFVIDNRLGRKCEIYDFVYGPIADDKVGLQLQKFNEGAIDKKELLNRLKYIKGITFQYYFGTEESLKYLITV